MSKSEPRPRGANRPIQEDWVREHDVIQDVWIYKKAHSAHFRLYLKDLPNVGFLCHYIPEDKWDWFMGSLSNQIANVAEKAYENGVRDARATTRKALGLRD